MPTTDVAERSDDVVHYSGVLIVAASEADVATLAERVDSMEDVEVHFVYPARARIIAVLEAGSVADHKRILERIQSLPAVVLAQPAYHFVDSMETSHEQSDLP